MTEEASGKTEAAERPPVPLSAYAEMIEDVKAAFDFMKTCGCSGFDCPPETLRKLEALGKPPESLLTIRTDLGDCRRCKLCQRRGKIVFGEGNPKAEVLFVGDAPGPEEDRTGTPFAGKAGELLDRIIGAMKLERDAVYLCCAVKCRTPGRPPEPDEIAACLPFLKRQIAMIRPRFICTLGETAAQALLKSKLPIVQLRGRFHDYQGIRLMPTFHPALLLQTPARKREVWEDMKMVMREMGHEI